MGSQKARAQSSIWLGFLLPCSNQVSFQEMRRSHHFLLFLGSVSQPIIPAAVDPHDLLHPCAQFQSGSRGLAEGCGRQGGRALSLMRQ